MNIFELSAQYQRVMGLINEREEIDEDLMAMIISVNDSLENKVLNYASIIKELEANEVAIDQAVESMLKRAKNIRSKAEKLKEIVKNEMKRCNKEKLENEYHKVRLVFNNPKVSYTDKQLIPEQFMRRKIMEVVEPNTLLISKALKENVAVPGAFLVKEQRLEIV